MAFHGYNKWFCTVKSLKSVTWKAHLKMMQSFFLHNSFSIIQVMGRNKEKTWNRPQKTVMPLTYGFSWLQEAIMYSKITKISDMQGSFENHVVILFAYFFIMQVMGLKDDKSWNITQQDCSAINLWLFMATRSDAVE